MQPGSRGRWLWGVGRASRREYWSVLVVMALGGGAIQAALATILVSVPGARVLALVMALSSQAALAWILGCAASRRLHDLGYSAWWLAAPILLALISIAIPEPAWVTRPSLGQAMGLGVAFLVSLSGVLFFIGIGLVRGAEQPNRFGPAPG